MASALGTLETIMSDRGAPSQLDASQLAAQELQNRFISENLRRIFLLIYRIVRNVDDAQDLTQEAFIKALQRQDQLKEFDKASHWLSRIASNTAIDFLRRNGKVNFTEIDSLIEQVADLFKPYARPRGVPGERQRSITLIAHDAVGAGPGPRTVTCAPADRPDAVAVIVWVPGAVQVEIVT